MAWSQGTTARWAALAIANLWCRRDTPLLVRTIKGPAFTQRTPRELPSYPANPYPGLARPDVKRGIPRDFR
jgi:hypothetical protein